MSATHELLVSVKADTAQMKSALDKADKSLTSFGQAAEKVEKKMNSWNFNRMVTSLHAVTSMAAGVISSVTSITKAVTGYILEVDKISKQTGIAVEKVSALRYAAEQSSVSFENVAAGMKTFYDQIGAASLLDAGAQEKLAAVGINWQDFAGLAPEEMYLKLADHISKITDETQRLRAANEAMGEDGIQSMELLMKGAEGLKAAMKEAAESGAIVTAEQVAQAKELEQTFAKLQTSLMGIGVQLIPMMDSVAEVLGKVPGFITGTVSKVGHMISPEWGKAFDEAGMGAQIQSQINNNAAVMPLISRVLTKAPEDPELAALQQQRAALGSIAGQVAGLDSSLLTDDQKKLVEQYNAVLSGVDQKISARMAALTGDLSNTAAEGTVMAELELAAALSAAGGDMNNPAVIAAQEKVDQAKQTADAQAFQKNQAWYSRAETAWFDFKGRWNRASADERLGMLAEKNALEKDWNDAAAALKASYPTYEEESRAVEEGIATARSTPELSFSSSGTFSGLEAMNQKVGGDVMEQQLAALQKIVAYTFEMANSKFSVFRKD